MPAGPEDDFVSFHIQGVGRWTKDLYKLCQEKFGASEDADFRISTTKRDLESGVDATAGHSRRQLLIHIDGPFGSPAQDYSSFNCLLLVVSLSFSYDAQWSIQPSVSDDKSL